MDKKIRQTIVQTLISIVLVLGIAIALSLEFKSELLKISLSVVGTIGILGIAGIIFVSDSLPAFFPIDFFLVLAIAAGINDAEVIFSCTAASIAGGTFSYLMGRHVFHAIPVIKSILVTYEKKMEDWVKVYGKKAVIVAAITPIPYSWMAYTAGSFKMRYEEFLYASSFRLLRFFVYFYAIKLGWFVV